MNQRVSTPTVEFRSPLQECRDAVSAWMRDTWPDSDLVWPVVHVETGPPAVTYQLYVFQSLREGLSGDAARSTSVRVDATFTDTPDAATREAALARAQSWLDEVGQIVDTTVPRTFTTISSTNASITAAPVAFAQIAAEHFGNRDIFVALVEHGVWQGDVRTADGSIVTVRLRFPAHSASTESTTMRIDAAVTGTEYERLGEDDAFSAADVVFSSLLDRMESDVAFSRPRLTITSLEAAPHRVEPAFFPLQNVRQLALRVADGRTVSGTNREMSITIATTDPPAKVLLTLGIDHTDAGDVTHVSAQITSTDGAPSAAQRRTWQEFLDTQATDLAAELAAEPVAPAFTVAAPPAEVTRRLYRAIVAATPGGQTEATDDGIRAIAIPLGEHVYGRIDIHVQALGFGSRVVLTGAVYGAGLTTEGAAPVLEARMGYLAVVTALAGEMRTALHAEFGDLPPQRGGLE